MMATRIYTSRTIWRQTYFTETTVMALLPRLRTSLEPATMKTASLAAAWEVLLVITITMDT